MVTSCSLFWCCNFRGNPLTLRGCPKWRGWFKMEILWKHWWTSSSESLFWGSASLLSSCVVWGAGILQPVNPARLSWQRGGFSNSLQLKKGRSQCCASCCAGRKNFCPANSKVISLKWELCTDSSRWDMGCAPLTWAALSLSFCPWFSGAHSRDWCGVCAWPGNNRVLSIISSSLLVSDYSFCCSLSPWTSVLQEKQVCGICLLNLSPCPLTPTPHQCQLLVKADSALCRGFLILQIYLSTLCNITWILQWSCCIFSIIYVLQFLEITGAQWDSPHRCGYPHMGFLEIVCYFRWKVTWICCFWMHVLLSSVTGEHSYI